MLLSRILKPTLASIESTFLATQAANLETGEASFTVHKAAVAIVLRSMLSNVEVGLVTPDEALSWSTLPAVPALLP